jgi:hypothetical protein
MSTTPDPSYWTASVDSPDGIVFYTEDPSNGSPRFSFEQDGTSAERDIFIQYEDLDGAKKGFVGYPSILGDDDTPYLSREIPDYLLNVYDLEGDPYVFATKMTAQGYGTPDDVEETGLHNPLTDTPYYELGKLQVTYETLTYDILSDQDMIDLGYVDEQGNPDESYLVRYVTKKVAPSAEYITLPVGGYYFYIPGFSGAAPPISGGPGKIVCSYDFSLTWHQIPLLAVPSALINPDTINPAIDDCLGCVNAGEFADQPTASCLLVGALITPNRSVAGDRLYTVEYRFKYINATTPVDDPDTDEPVAVGNQGVYYQGQAAVGTTPAIIAGFYEVSTGGSNLEDQDPNVNIYNYADFDSLFSLYPRGDDEGGE